jgi:hypothetical protein
MGFIRGFGQFWYDFIIGDDWKIAVAVVSVLIVGAVLVAGDVVSDAWLAPLLGVGVGVAFVVSLVADVRMH